MHEESERRPGRRAYQPIEPNDVGGCRTTKWRTAASFRLTAGLRIELLDGFACYAQGKAVDLSPSAQRLLAFITVRGGCVGRGIVIAALWPERDDRRGGGNLRSLMWRLPDAVRGAVRLHNGEVSLADASSDVDELTTSARSLLESARTLDDLSATSFAADLLPSWYDDWVIVERERLRQIRMHALEELSRRLTMVHRYGDAIDAALAAIAADPLRESAHRRLIEAHLAEGNVSEAIRQYETYTSLLSSELGVEPSPALGRLIGVGTR